MVHIHAAVLMSTLLLLGCASPRPVLYPNAKYEAVGKPVAESDVEECITLAQEFDATPPLPEGTTGDAVESTVVGGVTGGAVGAVVGNPGRGAAAGAVGGLVSTLTRAIFRRGRNRDTGTPFHVFVERCLDDRGYELVGWR